MASKPEATSPACIDMSKADMNQIDESFQKLDASLKNFKKKWLAQPCEL